MNAEAQLHRYCQEALTCLADTGKVPIWYRQAIYRTLGEPWHQYHEGVWDTVPADAHSRIVFSEHDKAGITPFPRLPQATSTETLGHRRRNTLWYLTADYGYRHALEHCRPQWSHYPLTATERDFFLVTYHAWFHLISQIHAGMQWEHVSGPFLPWLGPYDVGGGEEWLLVAFVWSWENWKTDIDLLHPLFPIRDDLALQVLIMDVPFFVGLGLRELDRDEGAFWRWWLTDAVPQAWAAHAE